MSITAAHIFSLRGIEQAHHTPTPPGPSPIIERADYLAISKLIAAQSRQTFHYIFLVLLMLSLAGTAARFSQRVYRGDALILMLVYYD